MDETEQTQSNQSEQTGQSKELEALRTEIDQADENIVALLAKRMEVAKQIKKIKLETGMATFDPGREEKLKARITELATKDGLSEEFALQLYDRILVESKRVQDSL